MSDMQQETGPATGEPLDLDGALALHPDAATVIVYRKEQGRDKYRGRLPAHPEVLEDVRATLGGGDYAFRLVDADNRYLKQVRQSVGGRPKYPEGDDDAPAGEAGRDGIREMMEMMNRGFTAMAEAIRESRQPAPPPPPAADPLETVAKVAEVLRAVQPAGNGGMSVRDMLDLIEFGRGDRGGEGDGGSGLAAIAQIGGELATIARKEQEMKARLGQLSEQRKQLQQAQQALSPLAQKIKPYVPHLLGWATGGDDPAERADVALALIPTAALDEVDAEDTALAARLVAELRIPADLAPWFSAFVQAMQARLLEENEEGGDDGNG